MGAITRLEPHDLQAGAELEAFVAALNGDGAVVSFLGLARGTANDGSPVERLELDWYPGMTEASLQTIAEAGAARFKVSDIVVVHRCGAVSPGETIVFVAAAARHRRDAFLAADYLMDRLKTDAAFWKREVGPTGTRLIEPAETDLNDRARWSD
jgi:molybdopterin synthase catalytic subunit